MNGCVLQPGSFSESVGNLLVNLKKMYLYTLVGLTLSRISAKRSFSARHAFRSMQR